MRRNENGIAVPDPQTKLPLVVRDVMHESDQFSHGKAIFDANGEEFIGLYAFQSEDDMEFVAQSCNYHERFADIVRRLAEVNKWARPGISLSHAGVVIAISEDAAALWAEYREETK